MIVSGYGLPRYHGREFVGTLQVDCVDCSKQGGTADYFVPVAELPRGLLFLPSERKEIMDQIRIFDTTLCAEEGVFGFKEKLEIVRQLERLQVDVIELPEIQNNKADCLFVRTSASFLKHSVLSVACGSTMESLELALSALDGVSRGKIRVSLPMSVVGMEYIAHKKPQAMLEWVPTLIKKAKEKVSAVEFCAVDATRAEKEFLFQIISLAVEAGATEIGICDSAAEVLPDDFADFVGEICEKVSVPVVVSCDNKNGLAAASSVLSVKKGAKGVKADINGVFAPLEDIASLIKNCGKHYDLSTSLRLTELHRIAGQIRWISSNVKNEKAAMTVSGGDDQPIRLDVNDDQATVIAAVAKLGYDLSEEDQKRVFEEFLRVAGKKSVTSKELDAIVASAALQVPATYKLVNYVINNGNIITASAQITLEKGDERMQGVCIGDGPVDAAFRAIDQILGHHYELDDFQIQSVTEGKEAMGSAIVKLRAAGKLYSGNGISTDIIGASIRAYLNAVNKIVYEEV